MTSLAVVGRFGEWGYDTDGRPTFAMCARGLCPDDLRADFGCATEMPGRWKLPDGLTLDRCPMSYVTQPDPYRDAVVAVWQDVERGIVTGWPDDFAAGIVDGVRCLDAERNASQRRVFDRARERRA